MSTLWDDLNELSSSFYRPIHQVCVLRLIQVVSSVEKIEKILHSQSSKESSSLEISRWETDMLASLDR